MAKKRMILEEVPELNPLVPGTPDNPIKLGEKAKNLLVQLSLYEDDGRGGQWRARNYDEGGGYAQAQERLEFLKLVEYKPEYNDKAVEKMKAEQVELRARLAQIAPTAKHQDLYSLLEKIRIIADRLNSNTKGPWLTQAGRDVLLTGTVTVSL